MSSPSPPGPKSKKPKTEATAAAPVSEPDLDLDLDTDLLPASVRRSGGDAMAMASASPAMAYQSQTSSVGSGRGADEKIQVRVVDGSDDAGVVFKIGRNQLLGKLMNAYGNKKGINPSSVRFMQDGDRVGAKNTLDDLDVDGDGEVVIEVFQDQEGGGKM